MTEEVKERYEFNEYRLDVEKQELLKNGNSVQLTHKAFQILHLLVQNSGQTTKKEDIFNRLWSDSFVEEANITQHIYVLRKALGQTPEGNSYIETVPKQGYRFTLSPNQIKKTSLVAEPLVSEAKKDETESEIIENTLQPEENNLSRQVNFEEFEEDKLSLNGNENINSQETLDTAFGNRLLSRHLIAVLLLFVVFGISVVSVYYYRYRREQQSSQLPVSVQNIKSIAVLPFKPLGEKVDKEKLGFGMADAVITRLSNLQRIEVRPSSAVFRYADNPAANALNAGRDLQVDAVLEGTVQCDGERVRVSVQLVRVADGKPLWAETFQEEIPDIFAVQDSISAKLATALSLNLSPQQEKILSESGTTNHEAFQAYQLGIYLWNKRSKDDLLKAAEYFNQAIQYDPKYAQAYAMLSDSYSMLGFYRFADVGEMKEKARVAAEKALEFNDSLADAYVALASMHILEPSDHGHAQQLLERAIALAPYNASARHRYGWILISKGLLDEGTREMRLAQRYDPLSFATNKALCSTLIFQRNFGEAAAYWERVVELSPDTPGNKATLAYIYALNKRYDEAIELAGQEKEISGKAEWLRITKAYIFAMSGRLAEAEKIYDEVKSDAEKHTPLLSHLALTSYAIGRKQESLAYFKEMIQKVDSIPDQRLLLAYSPDWDKFKADPEFAPLFPK